ncbi:capsule biosynthesis protein [Caulobacter sp. CCNWLY153]|uniref:capsule biosynthesis protein n=1 Tax=unclassified Caulobacter TaxID=2648921 RepID=UPI002FF167C5
MDGFAPPPVPAVELEASPRLADPAPPTGRPLRSFDWKGRLRQSRAFLLLVMAPTLLAAIYYFLFAADLYESEAHFLVRANAASASAPSGLGQMLGLGGASSAQVEARALGEYLGSHDAVSALQARLNLRDLYQTRDADLLSRLHGGSPESLLKYYRGKVRIAYAPESGVTTLTVQAYHPQDARRIASMLLELGEARINGFNQRALDNALGVSSRQVRDAERQIAEVERALTRFRQGRGDMDPERTGAAQITALVQQKQQLSQASAQLASMSTTIAPDAPQRVALANQVRALQAQVVAAQGSLAGSDRAVAATLGTYEALKLRQGLAAKQYEAAQSAALTARAEALKQQVYVVRVVEPNLPVKALAPARIRIVVTIFFGLLLAYGVGWLILAGVREHAS